MLVTSMGDELCFVCVGKRVRLFSSKEDPDYQRPDRTKKLHVWHHKDCNEYKNVCLHVGEDPHCPFKEDCEFQNPTIIYCSPHCFYAKKKPK